MWRRFSTGLESHADVRAFFVVLLELWHLDNLGSIEASTDSLGQSLMHMVQAVLSVSTNRS